MLMPPELKKHGSPKVSIPSQTSKIMRLENGNFIDDKNLHYKTSKICAAREDIACYVLPENQQEINFTRYLHIKYRV